MKKKIKALMGFATMELGQRRIIASMGGKAQKGKTNPGNFRNRPTAEVSRLGRLGGMSQGKHSNSGNFAHDRVRAAKAGSKGGRN